MGINYKTDKHLTYFRLKYLLSSLESGNRGSGEERYLSSGVFSIGGEHISIDHKILSDNKKYISPEFYLKMNQGRVRLNDILLVKDGATIGKNAIIESILNEECAVNEHVFILRPNSLVNPKFLFYFLNSSIFIQNLRQFINGSAQPGLDQKFTSNISVPVPNLNMQKSIVKLLDQKTSEIDELISAEERLLELLEEKRVSIITQAVTKGLNPDAMMKSSGVDWLGDIPEHWEVKRLKYHSRINPTKSELKDDSLEVNFIPMENIGQYGGLTLDIVKNLSEVKHGYTYFESNDVIIAKITPCFENGKGALAENLLNGIAFGTTELHVLRAFDSIIPEYLKYVIFSYSFRKLGESSMIGAGGQKRVPTEFVKNFKIGIPAIDEQKLICNSLNEKLTKLDNFKSDIKLAIKKLREYKISLVTSAVTGKINLRDYYQEQENEKTH